MARIKVNLQGFEELYTQIQKAGGSIDSAAERCIRESAQVMQSELKATMQSTGFDSGIVGRMPAPEIKKEGNKYSAKVGYKMDGYNPSNLSDGFKALFYNFGTPNRTSHGKEAARGFIAKAKKKASPKIKQAQQDTLETILEGVSK